MSLTSDTGSKDRATVALVLAEVKTVTTLVEGHKDLTKLGFENVQRQLDAVAGLPAVVAAHEQRLGGLEAWREDEERRGNTVRDSRRVNLPTVIIASIAALMSIGELVTALVH